MRRIATFSSLKHRQDFGLARLDFDGKEVQKAQALSVLHEMSTQTLNLFTSQYSRAAWNQTLLESFCAGLYEQLNELEACLTQETGLEEPLLIHEDSRLAVRKYFNRITVYLKEKSYSPCAWEVVRAEIRRSFSFSATLQGRVQRKQ
uniref:Interferon 1AJ17 n=1 Tax=Cavia porcellus TaxID=10141 RepID=A0A7R8GUV7_CAVPO|nr:TPA: interferon 1AJ17 [Cavia porcellus]